MSRRKGLTQKPMAIRLNNELVEPLNRWATYMHWSKNRAINEAIKYFTDKYCRTVEETRIPGL